jgi:hypothetical protein
VDGFRLGLLDQNGDHLHEPLRFDGMFDFEKQLLDLLPVHCSCYRKKRKIQRHSPFSFRFQLTQPTASELLSVPSDGVTDFNKYVICQSAARLYGLDGSFRLASAEISVGQGSKYFYGSPCHLGVFFVGDALLSQHLMWRHLSTH